MYLYPASHTLCCTTRHVHGFDTGVECSQIWVMVLVRRAVVVGLAGPLYLCSLFGGVRDTVSGAGASFRYSAVVSGCHDMIWGMCAIPQHVMRGGYCVGP